MGDSNNNNTTAPSSYDLIDDETLAQLIASVDGNTQDVVIALQLEEIQHGTEDPFAFSRPLYQGTSDDIVAATLHGLPAFSPSPPAYPDGKDAKFGVFPPPASAATAAGAAAAGTIAASLALPLALPPVTGAAGAGEWCQSTGGRKPVC